MSTQAALAPVPEPAPPKETPQVTDAYRKAHKSYVLVSGLLASWELIGITLQTKEKWGIELKSPAAVPLILFILVFYSGYKMTIEWLQCDAERRKHRAAKLDYIVAHLIALTAIGISITQYLTRIQIIEVMKTHNEQLTELFAAWLASGFVGAMFLIEFRVLWLCFDFVKSRKPLDVFGVLAIVFSLLFTSGFVGSIVVLLKDGHYWIPIIGCATGIFALWTNRKELLKRLDFPRKQ